MVSEEACPATGRVCRNSACERGGCRKMRATPAKPGETKSAVALAHRIEPDAPAGWHEQLAAAIKARAELEAMLNEAIAALEHGDAALSLLQSSLGVKSSPRLEELRRVKLKLRAALKAVPSDAAPPAAA